MESFKHAFRGIFIALLGKNFKIQIGIFVCCLFFGIIIEIELSEWIIIFLTGGMVLALEIINTAIEELCNLYSTNENPKIKLIKDLSAGAVLVASIFSFVIGILIFLPKILN